MHQHCFSQGQESRFFQDLAHGFVADVFHIAQFHHATGEQTQCPARLPLRARTAGQGDQMRFLLAIQGAGSRVRVEAMGERILQPLVHEALADAHDHVATHLKGFCHLLIGPARTRSVAINLEEDAGMGLLPNWGCATRKQML